MSFDVTGYYTINIPLQTMFLNEMIKIKGHNLITLFGESFFMNRCINNEFDVITKIALGNSLIAPRKDDTGLGHETSRHSVKARADLKEKQIILTADFTTNEIIGTSEIGVFTDDIMVSHDRYNRIDDSFIGAGSQINVEYIYQFTTGSLKGGWNDTDINHVFYSVEPNTPIGVYERNTNTWYHEVNNKQDLSGNRGAFYYDSLAKNLYIRPVSDEVNLTTLTDNMEIIVQVK